MMQIISLFPTAVGQSQLERNFTLQEKLCIKHTLESLRPNVNNQVSIGTQILEQDGFADIKQFIKEQCEIYLANIYRPEQNIELVITQSWMNLTQPGERHHAHNHPNSFLSGCFYLDVDESDCIKFFHSVHDTIKLPTINYNEFNSDFWTIPVSNGKLLVWPSRLVHDVPPVAGNRPRVSLGFNTWLRGAIGKPNTLNYLVLS
jgi:uncharacterized protein (TIGR02466 family)